MITKSLEEVSVDKNSWQIWLPISPHQEAHKATCSVFGGDTQFDPLVNIVLPKELYKADFNDQKKECLEQLQSKLKNPFSNLRDYFTEDQIDDIMHGIQPDGFTWHHNEKEGLMQLVKTDIHDKTGHTGGMSIWGNGHK